ncbi:MAG TPA: hypothetical protein VJU87_04105 [Gemmatimonadaceae bacterium]|nr:hypothetical protein [Gemmatimonadaceae bacterium]
MAEIHTEHAHVAHRRSDMVAAIAGFLIGAVLLLIILGGIVELTNHHYAREKPAAAQG